MQFDEHRAQSKPRRLAEKVRSMQRGIRVTRLLASTALLCLCATVPAYAGSGYNKPINEIGLTLGAYRYKEPGLISLQGVKWGVNLQSTLVNHQRHTFIISEVRFAGGTVDYQSNGTGSNSDEPDWYIEGKLLLGNNWSRLGLPHWSSYVGLGYRYLMNDGRGLTTTGHGGYRRESNYLYFPIGIIHRAALSEGAKLVSTVEYDYLIKGTQNSHLSDVNPGFSDLKNTQHKGYGLKFNLRYTKKKWSSGPYLHYWKISDSDVQPLYLDGALFGFGLEPHNNTIELGIEFRQAFD